MGDGFISHCMGGNCKFFFFAVYMYTSNEDSEIKPIADRVAQNLEIISKKLSV